MKKLCLLIVISLVLACTVASTQEIPSYQIKNADNAEGWRLDSIHYYDFDGLINDSVMIGKDIYSINDYGDKGNIITYVTDGGGAWSPYIKQDFIYDEWQNEIFHNTYGWSSMSSTWVAMDRTQKHYHPGDTLIESLASAVWDGSVWKNQDSIYYSRDELNRIDSANEFFWSSSSSAYEPIEIVRKVYNTNNLVSSDTIYWYENNMWVLAKRSNYIYNSSGNVIDRVRMLWDEGSQEWKNSVRNTFEYDENQNLTLIEVFDWDETSSDWVYESYFIQTYDNNGNLDLLRMLEWNVDLQEFEKNVTGDHFWGFHVFIGMEDLQFSQALKVFPNPAREHVNVYVEEDCELVMFNISGQKLLSASLTKGNNKINVSDYPEGTYLLRTIGTNESASFKMMISR